MPLSENEKVNIFFGFLNDLLNLGNNPCSKIDCSSSEYSSWNVNVVIGEFENPKILDVIIGDVKLEIDGNSKCKLLVLIDVLIGLYGKLNDIYLKKYIK